MITMPVAYVILFQELLLGNFKIEYSEFSPGQRS